MGSESEFQDRLGAKVWQFGQRRADPANARGPESARAAGPDAAALGAGPRDFKERLSPPGGALRRRVPWSAADQVRTFAPLAAPGRKRGFGT